MRKILLLILTTLSITAYGQIPQYPKGYWGTSLPTGSSPATVIFRVRGTDSLKTPTLSIGGVYYDFPTVTQMVRYINTYTLTASKATNGLTYTDSLRLGGLVTRPTFVQSFGGTNNIVLQNKYGNQKGFLAVSQGNAIVEATDTVTNKLAIIVANPSGLAAMQVIDGNTGHVSALALTPDSAGYASTINKPIRNQGNYPPTNLNDLTDKRYVDNHSPDSTTLANTYAKNTVVQHQVWVETTGNDASGAVGRQDKPFLTTDAALDAVNAIDTLGAVLHWGVGEFLSPTASKIHSNYYFEGSGKPITNMRQTFAATVGIQPTTTQTPTKLIAGTILHNSFVLIPQYNIHIKNLGIDNGLDWVNAHFGGTAQEGLIINAQYYNLAGGQPSQDGYHQLQSNLPPRTGILGENVTILLKDATSPVHAILNENTNGAKFVNISTYYGEHGFANKALNTQLINYDGHGHGSEGLILISNDYAYGNGGTFANIYLTSITGYDGAGINIVANNTPADNFAVTSANVTNFRTEFVKYGIATNGRSDAVNINGGVIYKTQGIGINIQAGNTNSSYSNIYVQSGLSTGVAVTQSIDNSIVLSNIRALGNSGDGYQLSATGNGRILTNGIISGANAGKGAAISGNVYGGESYFEYENASATTGVFAIPATSTSVKEYFPTYNDLGQLKKSSDIYHYPGAALGIDGAQNIQLTSSGTLNWGFGANSGAANDNFGWYNYATSSIVGFIEKSTNSLIWNNKIIASNINNIRPDADFTHASPPTATSTGKKGDVWYDTVSKDKYEWVADNSVAVYPTGQTVLNEIPSGAINGSNTIFTWANTPISGKLSIFYNGQLLRPTIDYTTSAAVSTLTFAPITGSSIYGNYIK